MATAISQISPLLLGLGAFVLYLFASRFRTWTRLRHIPGPRGAGWSRFWLIRHQLRGTLPNDVADVCEKYGPLARVGPNWVVCSDPSEIRRTWGVRSGFRRADWYKGYRFDPNSDSILTAVDNEHHHRLKTNLLPGYLGRNQPGQEKIVDTHIANFIALIDRSYLSLSQQQVKKMDMGRVFQFLTQDITSAVEFGEAFGYLEANCDRDGVIAALEGMQGPCALFSYLPELLAVVTSRWAKPLMPKPTDTTGIGRLVGMVQEMVGTRYGEKKTKGVDALQQFVDSDLTQKEVEAEALVHLLGGADTTATALRNTIFYLSTTPAAYRRLQSEIDAFLPNAARPIIADAQAKTLPYLQACIKESLRLWPPIAGLAPKVSARDEVICGFDVPAGTYVAWAIFGVMRDKGVFGDDADVFEPGRWLGREEKKLREMESVQGLVFNGGTRWECLGRRLAYTELGKVLFELFARYDFSMVNPVEPFHWNIPGMTVQEKMDVRIVKRAGMD
ncbi:cytochrome P450 family protein [Echria macrotheca]|uniref:Cytochrome P450 family protein n=1 Tax=Echria macrotheca TaxID=438768 RepID=A0AAJ0FBL9_9PEZI|nr:cytochrome P450 family protein [Echria macrotheca]